MNMIQPQLISFFNGWNLLNPSQSCSSGVPLVVFSLLSSVFSPFFLLLSILLVKKLSPFPLFTRNRSMECNLLLARVTGTPKFPSRVSEAIEPSDTQSMTREAYTAKCWAVWTRQKKYMSSSWARDAHTAYRQAVPSFPSSSFPFWSILAPRVGHTA